MSYMGLPLHVLERGGGDEVILKGLAEGAAPLDALLRNTALQISGSGPPLYAGNVSIAIWRLARALRFPHHLAQAFHGSMVCVV